MKTKCYWVTWEDSYSPDPHWRAFENNLKEARVLVTRLRKGPDHTHVRLLLETWKEIPEKEAE